MRVSQHRVSQYRGHSSRRNGNSSNNTGWRETASANRDNSLRVRQGARRKEREIRMYRVSKAYSRKKKGKSFQSWQEREPRPLPNLRSRGQVVRRKQERVDTVGRERRTAERLVREPNRKLLVRCRLEAAPDVLDVRRVPLRVLLRDSPRAHMGHGLGRWLVRRLERRRRRRL